MALYALGDPHLCLGADKPMDVFGGRWEGYMEKLRAGFSVLTPDDTLVLLGDLSWALDMEQAAPDFAFLAGLPGRKLIVKGNHDYWWTTKRKFERFCGDHGFENLELIHNSCALYGEFALCGTRGWFYEEDRQGTHDEKIFRRELGRLEASLKAAGEREKLCFLHYPPKYRGYECPEILQLLHEYGVKRCYYGHLHADSIRLAIQGESDGIDFRLVSADYVNFAPQKVLD